MFEVELSQPTEAVAGNATGEDLSGSTLTFGLDGAQGIATVGHGVVSKRSTIALTSS